MNYLIEYQQHHFPFLHTTARKKSTKHKLIEVKQGLVAVRLGKHEYLAQAGQCVWLPFDCLSAVTYFPHAATLEVEISSRSTQEYSFQAGFVEPAPLLKALLERLNSSKFDAMCIEQSMQLKVVNFEIAKLKPVLSDALPTLGNLQALDNIDQAQLKLALKVRQALKSRSSGIKADKVINDVFDGDADLAEKLCQTLANQSLR